MTNSLISMVNLKHIEIQTKETLLKKYNLKKATKKNHKTRMSWLNLSPLNMPRVRFKDFTTLGYGEMMCTIWLLFSLGWLLFYSEFLTSAASVYREFLGFWEPIPVEKSHNVSDTVSHCLSIDYTTQLGRFVNLVSVCSVLTLLDRVNQLHHQQQESNRVHSRHYYSVASLCWNETLAYVSNIPNLITLVVGLVQAYSTTVWTPGWLPYPRGNYTNLIVSFCCWVFSVEREWSLYRLAQEADERLNSTPCYVEPDHQQPVRSDSIQLGQRVYLHYGDLTPARIRVLEVHHRPEVSGDCSKESDSQIGAYYNRESSGEDISQLVTLDSEIPAHRRLTRPHFTLVGEVIEYAGADRAVRQRQTGDVVPNFLDRARIFADLAGVCLLFTIALSMTASAFALEVSEGQSPSSLRIFQHLLAAAVSANTLIPSMRMTLLYNVYNLILSLCFRAIRVNSYHSMANLERLKQISFDKTGTLTETYLRVDGYYQPPTQPLQKLVTLTGWDSTELEFALAMGNSQSNYHQGSGWGTSPEENEILNYWVREGFTLTSNPLSESGEVCFTSPKGKPRSFRVQQRFPYTFGKGKMAHLTLPLLNSTNALAVSVRQDGTSFLAVDACPEGEQWAREVESRDKRRSMSIGFRLQETEQWIPVSAYSFENPLRPGVTEVMNFCLQEGFTPSIMTGDGREAAEELARRAGLVEPLDRIWNTETAAQAWSRLASVPAYQTVSIEASTLEKWLSEDPETAIHFLRAKHLCRVICRASSRLKKLVAHHTPHLMHVGDAANDAPALGTADVGVCLQHGAEVCRVTAGLIIRSPLDLIDLLSLNGYRDMLLRGGQRLLRDVCWMAGLTAGCLAIAIHRNRFRFLEGSALYLDAWRPLPMLIISSLQYTISVIGYASADCRPKRMDENHLICTSILFMGLGLGLGMCVSWAIRHYFAESEFEYLLLHSIDLLLLTRHSQHCLKWREAGELAPRRASGTLGNQHLPRQGDGLGLMMRIVDSVPGRILLYAFFYYLPLW